jgi:hypothetical protein
VYSKDGGVGSVDLLLVNRNEQSHFSVVCRSDCHEGWTQRVTAGLLEHHVQSCDCCRRDELRIRDQCLLFRHHLNCFHPGVRGHWETSIGDVRNEAQFDPLRVVAFVAATKYPVISVSRVDRLRGANDNMDRLNLHFKRDFLLG